MFLNLLTASGRAVAGGVARYSAEQGDWALVIAHYEDQPVFVIGDDRLEALNGAIIEAPHGGEIGNVPHQVRISTRGTGSGISVCLNDHSVGRVAASHMVSMGLRHHAFVGVQSDYSTTERMLGYQHGLHVTQAVMLPPLLFGTHREMFQSVIRTKEWMSGLLLPCAVFCSEDAVAAFIVSVAQELDLRVPEQIAVLGVGNDDIACLSTQPPISSIAMNGDMIGYEAARRLAHLMGGHKTAEGGQLLIDPGPVVQRGSTQIMGYDDLIVAEAMRVIISRAPREQLTVDQVAADLSVTRQLLYRSFQKCIGRSPKEEIDRVRGDQLKTLLLGSNLSLKQIAFEMGLVSASELTRFSQRLLGRSPLHIRRSKGRGGLSSETEANTLSSPILEDR